MERAAVAARSFASPSKLLDWLIEDPKQTAVFLKETINPPVLDAVLAHGRARSELRHTFLIRRPEEIAASFYALEADMRIQGFGIEALAVLHSAVREAGGPEPVVIDSDDLVHQPEAAMAAYCAAVDLPFIPESLSWESGERVEWSTSSRWHADTSTSTRLNHRRHPTAMGLKPTQKLFDLSSVIGPSTTSFVLIASKLTRLPKTETGRHQGDLMTTDSKRG